MTSVISVSGLVKTFGATRALDGLDLLVRAGEIHGFLGPNGSGKSTTLRVLLGLLRADAGQLRLRWATGHLIFAALGPAIALVTAGMTAGFAHGGRGDVPRLIAAALVQLPAVWVLVGITLALFGLAPRFARASWGVFAAGVVLGQLGPLLRLPPWVMNLSPFTHVPRLPGGVFEAAPLLALQGVAALLTIAGLLGWQRRDVG